jgi:hypothetical protein
MLSGVWNFTAPLLQPLAHCQYSFHLLYLMPCLCVFPPLRYHKQIHLIYRCLALNDNKIKQNIAYFQPYSILEKSIHI